MDIEDHDRFIENIIGSNKEKPDILYGSIGGF